MERASAACVCCAWRDICDEMQELWCTVDEESGETSFPRVALAMAALASSELSFKWDGIEGKRRLRGPTHPAEAALFTIFQCVNHETGVDALPSLLAAAEAAALSSTSFGARAVAVAVVCVSEVVIRAHPSDLHDILPSLVPPLITFFASPCVEVRKETVFALVDLANALEGLNPALEDLNHFLQPLSGAQRRLLNHYLQRAKGTANA